MSIPFPTLNAENLKYGKMALNTIVQIILGNLLPNIYLIH
jgi:hypothetical protein